jgi:hypothetical protein
MKKRGMLNRVNTEEVTLVQSKVIIETPYGEISYSGELNEQTLMTMPNGIEIPFYSLISHTNGDCLPFFVQPKQTK